MNLCSLDNSEDFIKVVNRNLPECTYEKSATKLLNLAMDRNLSIDYINFYSKNILDFILKPALNLLLKK